MAAEIAVKTVKKFIFDNPGCLDLVNWVLFDDETFNAYEFEIKNSLSGNC